jgi:hypothetical protein
VNAGEKSEFKPLEGLDDDPRKIKFNRDQEEEDDLNINHELIVVNKGKKAYQILFLNQFIMHLFELF